jgi:Uma2 family endonuclease
MALALAPPRVTEAEFLALPETMEHVELIDGEVYLSPSPLPLHQAVIYALAAAIEPWAAARRPAAVMLSPLDVRFGAGRILQPDLCVFLQRPALRVTPVVACPALGVEVLSGRRGHDRLLKRLVYAEAGVPEYWIVDPDDATVEVVRGLQTAGLEHQRVVSSALSGLEVDVAALFAGLEG